jgi:superfamily I DNA/RNA helicase/RecB family exonuclease
MTLQEVQVDPDSWPQAIADSDGPQLVVAGPGTGKTEFLVARAVHLVESGKAKPSQILLLTFSRRAAQELSQRVGLGLPTSGPGISASTFHSFAHRLLEVHGPSAFGWASVPTLLTGPEQVALVSTLLRSQDPALWPLPLRALLPTNTLGEELADFLLRSRERLLDPPALADLAADRPAWRALSGFMVAYDRELERRGRIDYGGLLAAAVRCLEDPTVAAALDEQFLYVLVDEYQDTSPAQARMLELLAGGHTNLTAAADPYQSVYSFRGAEVANVAEFEQRFGPLGRPRRLILSQSFRVPAEILNGALRIVAGGELPGGAGPVRPADHQGRVEGYVFDQATAEAEWIASEVEYLVRTEALAWSDIAILVRSTRHLLPELSRALGRRQIPHDTPDRRLVDHPAIQLVFDLALAASENRGSSDEIDRAVRRLLLGPLFGLSLSAERTLYRLRQRGFAGWNEIIRSELDEGAALADLLADSGWASHLPANHGFWHLWTSLPQLEGLVADDNLADYRAAWAAFAQVLDRQEERDPAVTLLDVRQLAENDDYEAVPLLSLQGRRADRITLTTLHQAKGLEFEVVFIADAAEGAFPDLRRSRALLRPEMLSPTYANSPNPVRLRLQEEMRLAYTAMTRARRRVVWTATSAAIDEGERRPSRFLLAALGVDGFDQVGPPQDAPDRRPVTLTEAQASLRRRLTDPTQGAANRWAALATLAYPRQSRPDQQLWDAAAFAGVPEHGPDTGLVSVPLSLSPSQADAYSTCPRRYALERRVQTSQESGPYAEFGSIIHRVLELAERQAVESRQPHAELGQALEILDQVWASSANFGSPVLNEAWLQRGRQLLQKMYSVWPGGEAIPVVLEKELTLEFGGHRWQGRADRIEQHKSGELRVVDYKTSKTAAAVGDAKKSLQLGFYLLAAAADPELAAQGNPTAAELWYPLGGVNRDFDLANLPKVADELSQVAAGIAAEDWTPRPGPHCGRCRVRIVCPAWPEGREGFVS